MTAPPRTIAVVTTSRADFSHLVWPLRAIDADPDLDLRLIVCAAHLAPEFGETISEIEDAAIPVHETVECLLSSDTDVGMAKTIGVAALGLTEVLSRLRPDLLLLIADRYEMLAPAAVAVALRIPIVHIEGGEVSQGAIDEQIRNALTKLAHVHLVPTETARRRVIGMGEEAWRVHRTGAPSLDHLTRSSLPDRPHLETRLGRSLEPAPLLIAWHPVTLARDTNEESDAFFLVLEQRSEPLLFCFPNADAGSRRTIARARELAARKDAVSVHINLAPTDYWGLLHHVRALLGNSSSGIMETASIGLPTINVGRRQQGRERAANVIDCTADATEIGAAIDRATSDDFIASLAGLENPYGDGHASERIVRVLRQVPLGPDLLIKAPVPLCPAEDA